MPSDEYRVCFTPWLASNGQVYMDQVAIFSDLEQIPRWIEVCRKQHIRITIRSIEHCYVERSEYEFMEAETIYMQTRTGQFGPTTSINMLRRKR